MLVVGSRRTKTLSVIDSVFVAPFFKESKDNKEVPCPQEKSSPEAVFALEKFENSDAGFAGRRKAQTKASPKEDGAEHEQYDEGVLSGFSSGAGQCALPLLVWSFEIFIAENYGLTGTEQEGFAPDSLKGNQDHPGVCLVAGPGMSPLQSVASRWTFGHFRGIVCAPLVRHTRITRWQKFVAGGAPHEYYPICHSTLGYDFVIGHSI